MAKSKPFDEQGINKRFRELREKMEGPRGKLRMAKKIGESHSNVSRYEGSRTIPAHVIARLVQVYNVNAEWLLTGKGPLFRPTRADEVRSIRLTVPSAEEGTTQAKSPSAEDLSDFCVLPLLKDPTAAGPGRRITDADVEGPAVIHRAWCPHPSRTDYVRVTGDSMEPGIPDGSIVTIDKTYKSAESSLGKVVAIYIATTEEVTLRRLQRDGTRAKRYIGVPDNMNLQNHPVTLGADDRIIGRVVSVHALVK